MTLRISIQHQLLLPLLSIILCIALEITCTSSCKNIDQTLAPSCFPYISWVIPDEINIIASEYNATGFAEQSGGLGCPYYETLKFQCPKYFPQCVSNSSSGGDLIRKVCRSQCYTAKTANGGQCRHFSDEYFNKECSQDVYSDSPDCFLINMDDSSGAFETWKIILISVLLGIGLLMLASYLFTRWREYRYNPETDPYIDEVVEKESTRAQQDRALASPAAYHDIDSSPPPVANVPRKEVTMEMRQAAFRGELNKNKDALS